MTTASAIAAKSRSAATTALREVMAAVRHVVTIGEEGPAIAAALAGAVPTTAAPDDSDSDSASDGRGN